MKSKLLLIEDNYADVFIFKEALNNESFPAELSVISNGRDALKYFERSESGDLPDLVLMDLNLPQINGFEILQKIKANIYFKNIPIVVLSTSTWALDKEKCKQLGAAEYFTKPIDFNGYAYIINSLKQLLKEKINS